MSDAATNQSSVHFGWALRFGIFTTELMQQAFEPCQANEAEIPPMTEDHVADLLYKIDHGFIVEETGERARIPRFARAHLKTSVQNLG